MKFLATLMACMLVMTSACAKSPKKVNIVFIGNSITYGANIDHKTQAPPVRVSEQLTAQGYEVNYRNCGVSGSTTVDWLPQNNTWIFKNMVKAGDELCQLDGQLVFTMMLGTNDSAIDCCTGAPVAPADYYQNLKTIVDYILNRYPSAKVIINYPIWYSRYTYNATRYLTEGLNRLQTYLPQIDALCKAYKKDAPGRVMQGSKKTFKFFENRTELFVPEPSSLGQGLQFYLHPNPTGAIKLAQFWTSSIKSAVKQENIVKYQ